MKPHLDVTQATIQLRNKGEGLRGAAIQLLSHPSNFFQQLRAHACDTLFDFPSVRYCDNIERGSQSPMRYKKITVL